MNILKLVAILLLLSFKQAPTFSNTSPLPTQLPPNAVVVVEILGQSNAWGTNSYITDVPMGAVDPEPDTFIWDKVGSPTATTHIDDGAWAPLTVGYGRSGPLSFGPEMRLARELHEAIDRPIYVVKCARGMTIIAERPAVTDWNSDSTGEMYDLWRDYYHRPAMLELAALHGPQNVFIIGVNWFQGAADAQNLYNLPYLEYEQNLRDMIQAVRMELSSRVVISVGRSENYVDPQFPFINEVRASQVLVARTTKRCRWYSTNHRTLPSGEVLFEYGPDGHHFDGRGQLDLGYAMAKTLLSFSLFEPVF